MTLYSVFLFIHSIARWLVVIAGLLAAGKALWGWLGKKEWTRMDERLGLVFIIGMDVEVAVGILLYIFFSPLTLAAFQNFGAAMRNADLRFWTLEHILMMIIALVLAHVGRALAKKANDAAAKHKRLALFFTAAMLLVIIYIPWARPFFRLP